MATIPAKAISLACIVMLLSIPSFGEETQFIRFPVGLYSTMDNAPVWVAPPPESNPVMDVIPDGTLNPGVRNASIAMMAAGGLLCAGGIVVVTHGLSHDMNTDTIHTGTLMIISGALTAALFSVVFRASTRHTPKITAQE